MRIDTGVELTRRKALATIGCSAGLWLADPSHRWALAQDRPRVSPPSPASFGPRKKVAAVVTTYFPNSHADHIVGRFLWGYQWKGKHHQPGFEVVSLVSDQHPADDKIPRLAERFGFRLCKSPAEALRAGGTELGVDAVLLIGEHGEYPNNAKGQKLYPRFELYEQIVEVFRKSNRSVPVFNDKHLSYDFNQAKTMVEQAKELGFGFMAGSSLPVTWRNPELEPELGSEFKEALVAAYGPEEIYGFHALETLQCMVERRAGGETGVKALTCLKGNEVWKAGDSGLWSWDLLEHALGRSETLSPGDIRYNVAEPFAIVVEYADGLRGAILLLNGHIADFNFAAYVKGSSKPISCQFYLPNPPGANYFSSLTNRIEVLFETGKPPYPVERTLLTSGVLDFALGALASKSGRTLTPQLDIAYRAPKDSGFAKGSPASPVVSD